MNTTGKGLILVVSGIIVAFFPQIISSLFYIIGVAVIIFSVINIIRSLTTGSAHIVPDIIGILIGSAITSLPHFVQTIIPLTIGLILAFNGIDYAVRAFNNNGGSRAVNALLAAIDLVLGGTLLFNLVSAGNATRIIAGVVMIATGVYDFISNKKSGGSTGNIIDI